MDLTTFKLVAFVAIFLVGLAGGALARTLAAGRRSELLFSLGNVFAGGVFLGAGLIHMLPDAQEGFSDILPDSEYPWFAVACALGFLSILFLEQVLFRRDHHDASTFAGTARGHRMLYPYILMLTLSIHSVITGIALGTEDRITQAVVILIAVLAHKSTAAFALGISLLRNQIPTRRAAALIGIFSLATPLGILLGALFMRMLSGRAEGLFEAVFDALAAGTFLYIAIVDILDEELGRRKALGLKFSFALLGFAIMALVEIWT